MMSLHWSGKWLGAFKQQAIYSTNSDHILQNRKEHQKETNVGK